MKTAGRAQATMLTLAAIALVIPAAYSALVGELYPGGGMALSISISLVLLPSMSRSFCSLCGLTLTLSGASTRPRTSHFGSLAAWAVDRGARRRHCRDRMAE